MRAWVAGAAAAFVLAIGGCGQKVVAPPPREPDAASIGYFCHMSLPEHPGPKGQIFLKDQRDPLWFSSVKDTFTYLEVEATQPSDVLAVYVNDMALGTWEKPAAGAWIEARKAVYVLGSSKSASMGGAEAVPFADRPAAERFIAEYGGMIADFAGAAKAMATQ